MGYHYLSLKDAVWDEDNNIFTEVFKQSLCIINPDLESDEAERLLGDVKLSLDNEDLGKVFYEMLIARSGLKLIDFEDFSNNTFNVVTELTYKKAMMNSGLTLVSSKIVGRLPSLKVTM